jgi:hypothetical protein
MTTQNFRVYAYLRASTEEQDATRARETLEKFAIEKNIIISNWFIENASGTKLDRPELNRLINSTIPGDVLLVEHTDRLTRLDKKDWGTLSALLRSKGIFVVYVSLPTTHDFLNIEFRKASDQFSIMEIISKFLEEIMAQVSYAENAQRKIRIVQGLKNALKNGVKLGRRKGELGKRVQAKQPSILVLLKNRMGTKAIAKELGICQLTVSRVAKANSLQWLGHELGWVQKTETKLIKSN